MGMSLRRQGVVVAMLAGVAALAAATAFALLARFQTVPVRLPDGIEASRGPVARVEVPPGVRPPDPAAGPAVTAEERPGAAVRPGPAEPSAPPAASAATSARTAHPARPERSCGNGPPTPG